MKALVIICAAACAAFLSGCNRLESTARLRLPPGSAEAGKAAFISLQCTECHTVAGVDLPRPTVAPERIVELGGAVRRLRTAGDLLTAIIHPQASISDKVNRATLPTGETPMPNVNTRMTVAQMVDLVRFLQPQYSEMAPPQDWNYSF